ncbi:rCG31460 [Rattus norvegicus]|uniref:RCG31460 n=1 Tax=Rattus norvegicus TaxID=10116 RepID=A6ISQ4_RAT|nr:rCG31460 [Rattus norvegicus]
MNGETEVAKRGRDRARLRSPEPRFPVRKWVQPGTGSAVYCCLLLLIWIWVWFGLVWFYKEISH